MSVVLTNEEAISLYQGQIDMNKMKEQQLKTEYENFKSKAKKENASLKDKIYECEKNIKVDKINKSIEDENSKEIPDQKRLDSLQKRLDKLTKEPTAQTIGLEE